MSDRMPSVSLARHGETAWSLSGQHTGTTDLPLTDRGEDDGRALGERLRGIRFDHVFTSPLQRAKRTCELAGFGASAIVDPDLMEWNYGDYEGRTSKEILSGRPGWALFRDGCPNGESPAQVAARADRVIAKARATGGDVLLFSSGHFLRMVGARWLGLEPRWGTCFYLGTGSLSQLSYEHSSLEEPVIRLWNETRRS